MRTPCIRKYHSYLEYVIPPLLMISGPANLYAQSSDPAPETQPPEQAEESEIVVKARKVGTTVKIDRIVYDIETRVDGASLNAIDVLKKLPGIIVDPSRRISFRGGASIGFLVDGKSVRNDVALAIPASQIERVELITNPSAEFDSNTDALVNLVLKKDANLGWSGSGSGKLDTLDGFKTGVNIGYGVSKWSFNGSLSAGVESEPSATFRSTDYSDLQEGRFINQIFDASEDSTFRQISAQGKLTRQTSDNGSLSFVFGTNINKNPKDESGTRTLTGPGFREVRDYNRIVSFDGFYPYSSLTFENSKKDDYTLTSSIEAYFGNSDELRQVDEIRIRNFRDELKFSFVEGKLEYKKNLTRNNIVTVGVTISRNEVDDEILISGFSGAGEQQSTDFGFQRETYTGYVTFEAALFGLTLKPGLRFEHIDQSLKDEQGSINGYKGSNFVLPSLLLSKQIGKKNSLNASFTVRAERPDALNFNPFRKFVSPFQIETGNPFLRPSTKRQVELSHNYQAKTINFNQTLYYRDKKKDLTNFTVLEPGGITVTSFENLGSSKAYGYTANIKGNIGKKITVSADVDIFKKKLLVQSSLTQFDNVNYVSANANLNLDYVINKQNSFSAKVGYTGETRELSVVRPDTWTTDLLYTHTFRNDFSLTVNVINLGVREKTTSRFFGPGFQGFERNFRASRLVRIGLSKPF